MKRRSVHVITKYFYPVTAGIENNIMQSYSPLTERGWDITVHTSKDTYDDPNSLPDTDEVKSIKIKRYRWNPFLGFWPVINWNNADFICLHNFNIIPHIFIMMYVSFLKLLGKKRFSLFITPHGGYSPEWRTFSPAATLIKKIYHNLISVQLVNWSVDGIRAVSDWEKQEMVDAGISENLIGVIKNGLEDEAYLDVDKLASDEIKSKVKKLGKYIIQIGRVYPIKNQEAVINAMSQINKNVKFVIVGPVQDMRYKKKLENKIKRLGLQDRVKFFGVIRGVDKYYLLKNAKAMVHMALWEGNCNVIHEAWSQDVVCIVADNKGLNEQIKKGKNGYLVGENDIDQLSKSINYVLNNQNNYKLKQFRKLNHKYAEENSWKEVSKKVGEYYVSRSLLK